MYDVSLKMLQEKNANDDQNRRGKKEAVIVGTK